MKVLIRTIQLLVCLGITFALTNCKKDEEVNEAPSAEAGDDITIALGETATLDGSSSSDPEERELNYSWSIVNAPSGSSADVDEPTNTQTTFTPDEQGEFLITLSVTDGYSDPVTDEILISATYPGAPPVADAGENKCSVPGRIVLPDGSASSDPDGDDITYSWSIAEGPSNANTAITAETSASPEFTTNEAGQYFLALEVSDGIWDPVYDTVEINIFIPTVIDATITENTTIPNLCDDPDVPDVYLEGTESVRAVLTFEPGVRMEADADTHLKMDNEGRLVAQGTSADTIVFIGKTDEKAFWQGLIVRDNTNSMLDYVKISSAGRETALQGTAAIYTSTNGTFALTNSKITNNAGYGIQANSNGENIMNLSNVNFSNNGSNGLYLTPKDLVNVASNLSFSNNGDDRILMNGTRTSNDGIWPAYNYLVDGSLIVNSDVEIEAGAVFELDMAYIWVDNVTFDAVGTADNPIVFTAETQHPGNWFGIQYRGTSRGTFDYVEVSYAGDGSDADNANIELCNSRFTITNSTISNGARYGIFVNNDVTVNSDYQTANDFSNNASGPVFTSGSCPPLQ